MDHILNNIQTFIVTLWYDAMSKKDMSFRDIVALCNTLGIKNKPKFKIKRGKNGKYQYKARLKLKAKFYLEYSIMDIEKKG